MVNVTVCLTDDVPPHIAGGENVFDPAYPVGTKAPGKPALLYLDNIRQVKVQAAPYRAEAVKLLLARVAPKIAAQGFGIAQAGDPIPTGASEIRGPGGVKTKVWLLPPAGIAADAPGAYDTLLMPITEAWPKRVGVVRANDTTFVARAEYSTPGGPTAADECADACPPCNPPRLVALALTARSHCGSY